MGRLTGTNVGHVYPTFCSSAAAITTIPHMAKPKNRHSAKNVIRVRKVAFLGGRASLREQLWKIPLWAVECQTGMRHSSTFTCSKFDSLQHI